MTETLRLHYAPDNASLCVRIALEELGLPYQTTLVDRSKEAQRSAAYLALNPNGLIPVLETPHGPVFETAAILLWLADRSGKLMPPPDGPDRAHALQWLFWLSNTLHATQRMLFYPNQYSVGNIEPLRIVTRKRLVAKLDLLNTARNAAWIDAEDATALGCYLGPLLRWCAIYGGSPDWYDLDRWPRLRDFAKRVEQRPAVIRVARAEGLGATPFSAPQPCDPPEGSAV
ncbi:glutathione S-transferase family protein [Cognatiyoonia sp. IB215446]|uniref:glutathione S-transferase family protein n=1 Tax=Cognatiyoonia sp. IB215446 TaxID=3097355 RepID=UPI002A0B3A13|nr:glutathione S-transferase family protein [Cognatiyoonia sp. IB215446]MDX8348288.1 glutathione S-transferase family protein [Cognatiyoonia sp. IB215446]